MDSGKLAIIFASFEFSGLLYLQHLQVKGLTPIWPPYVRQLLGNVPRKRSSAVTDTRYAAAIKPSLKK
jgi:hypothetical protein